MMPERKTMMEQIKDFTILGVEMEGFKRFKEPFQMELGTVSYVSGANGQGKTSIADAIAYAFCGTPLWGEKSCDRLLNHESKTMKVTVTFVDKDGEIHTLCRSRQGSSTVIMLDGNQLRQTDVVTLFAEKDVFLSIFNPLYFIEKLGDNGGALLQRMLPQIGEETVKEALGGQTYELLKDISLMDPVCFIKNKREDIRELEESNTYLEGQIDLLRDKRKQAAETIDAVIDRGKEMISRKEALEEKQFAGIDVEKLKRRQTAVASQFSETKRKALLQKEAELKAKQYVSQYLDELKQLQAKIKELYEKHTHLIRQAKSIQPGKVCPVCKMQITDENYQLVLEQYKSEILENSKQGKSIKNTYEELLQLDRKSREKFEEFRSEDLKKVEAALTEMDHGDISEIAMLEDKIRLGNLTQQEYDELIQLQEKALEYAKELEALCATDTYPKEIENLEASVTRNQQQIESLKNMIQAAEEFQAKRMELMLQNLRMDHAAIKLYEVVKSTGELKDVFKFTYDGKDYRWLSNSERIRAGLEVAQLLRKLTGLSYPTYIDNAEGMTRKPEKVDGQMICAFARKGELSVQIPVLPRDMKEAA